MTYSIYDDYDPNMSGVRSSPEFTSPRDITSDTNNTNSPLPEKPKKLSTGGFKGWWDRLPTENRAALTSGLMSAGLKIMEAGGRSYDRPVSALSVAGTGGLQGLEEHNRTLTRERDYGLRTDYLKMAKDQENRSKTLFDATSPYAGEHARLSNELMDEKVKRLGVSTGRNVVRVGAGDRLVDRDTGKEVYIAPDKLSKPEYTHGQALKELASIDSKIAMATKPDVKADAELSALMTKIGHPVSIGGVLNEKERAVLLRTLNTQRVYVSKFIPTGTEKLDFISPKNRTQIGSGLDLSDEEDTISQEDLEFTAEKYGLSIDEVKEYLEGR